MKHKYLIMPISNYNRFGGAWQAVNCCAQRGGRPSIPQGLLSLYQKRKVLKGSCFFSLQTRKYEPVSRRSVQSNVVNFKIPCELHRICTLTGPCLIKITIFVSIELSVFVCLKTKNCRDLYYFELIRNASSQCYFLVTFRAKLDDWLQAIKWYLDNDSVVRIMTQIDTVNLPIVPIYIYMYISELYASTRTFTKTFREKACNKQYCKENRRAVLMIKFIWLFFVPLLLTTSPRRLCLPQAVVITLVSIGLYVSALRKKASCISAFMTTAVSLLHT